MRVSKRNDRKSLHAFGHDWRSAPTSGIPIAAADSTTRHDVVNHRSKEWVRGDVHTNTVEGVFSLFKRSIVGCHQVSGKHLDRYLDEFGFNNRKNPYLFRDTLTSLNGTALP